MPLAPAPQPAVCISECISVISEEWEHTNFQRHRFLTRPSEGASSGGWIHSGPVRCLGHSKCVKEEVQPCTTSKDHHTSVHHPGTMLLTPSAHSQPVHTQLAISQLCLPQPRPRPHSTTPPHTAGLLHSALSSGPSQPAPACTPQYILMVPCVCTAVQRVKSKPPTAHTSTDVGQTRAKRTQLHIQASIKTHTKNMKSTRKSCRSAPS